MQQVQSNPAQQRSAQVLSDKPPSDVEAEVMKMTVVVKEIRMVLSNILKVPKLDKTIEQKIANDFLDELYLSISNFDKFPVLGRQDPYKRIQECEEDQQQSMQVAQIHSRLIQNLHLSGSKIQPYSDIDFSAMATHNKDLQEQNEYLSQKIREAEIYIKRMEVVNRGLLGHPFRSSQTKQGERQKLVQNLEGEVQNLRRQLQEAQTLLIQNNQSFVREFQTNTQKLWKVQNELRSAMQRAKHQESIVVEKDICIQRLKQQNFKFEVSMRTNKTNPKCGRDPLEKMLRDRMAIATSLDIHNALKK